MNTIFMIIALIKHHYKMTQYNALNSLIHNLINKSQEQKMTLK